MRINMLFAVMIRSTQMTLTYLHLIGANLIWMVRVQNGHLLANAMYDVVICDFALS